MAEDAATSETCPGGRRADDRARTKYQQATAHYALLMMAAIVGASFLRANDLGPNLTSLLEWVVISCAVTVLASVLGNKEMAALIELMPRRNGGTKS